MTRGMISPDVVRRRRPKPKPLHPSPAELADTIREICADAEAIGPMYRRLHGLGLERSGGGSVRVSGSPDTRKDGSRTGYVPEIAITDARADARRRSAKWVAQQLQAVAKTLFLVRQGLEAHVGPTAGYRQPHTIGSDALVSMDEFRQALENQAGRLAKGEE